MVLAAADRLVDPLRTFAPTSRMNRCECSLDVTSHIVKEIGARLDIPKVRPRMREVAIDKNDERNGITKVPKEEGERERAPHSKAREKEKRRGG